MYCAPVGCSYGVQGKMQQKLSERLIKNSSVLLVVPCNQFFVQIKMGKNVHKWHTCQSACQTTVGIINWILLIAQFYVFIFFLKKKHCVLSQSISLSANSGISSQGILYIFLFFFFTANSLLNIQAMTSESLAVFSLLINYSKLAVSWLLQMILWNEISCHKILKC